MKNPVMIVGIFFLIFGLIFSGIGLFMVICGEIEVGSFFTIIGLIFAIIGLIMVVKTVKSNNKYKELKATGQLINAQITNVFVDYNLTVNGRHPYKIECGYLASNGQYFQFISKGVWKNPQHFIGNVCPVYVNPNNPNEYYVDTSWLGN